MIKKGDRVYYKGKKFTVAYSEMCSGWLLVKLVTVSFSVPSYKLKPIIRVYGY